ncbi:AAA family ATPase [Neptunomonas concharum]|uniref:Nuclease SbcCD subunit C n=1 Tax=Neptunomonas concharum TaxID=1031538 RepID=A0A5P1RAT2_9GAMM|nr:SMC family ATPase [Neptunomonas concharum]QEQ96707.1 SMC family ATPase [Neptunomonas concharum]
MQPLVLEMSAFGPFAAQEVIDFKRLGERPLFLINGPTGSGKTTLLDAICFALYGKTTGDEREGAQMRSDLANAEQLTEVSFTFALSGQVFRVRRVPEQARPKSRGEGFTQQSAEAQLWQLAEDGTELRLIVSNKVTEATREIEQLLGLNVDQFRQVMVLPQGKFRQLLMADSKDREHIFSQLFQTQIYKKLEDELKIRSAEIRREADNLTRQKTVLLEQSGANGEESLVKNHLEIKEKTDCSYKKLEECRHQENQTREYLRQSETLLARFAQLDELRKSILILAEQSHSIEADKLRLQRASVASQLQPAYDQYLQTQQRLSQAERQLTQAEELLNAKKTQQALLAEETQKIPHLQQQINEWGAQKQEVARYLEKSKQLQGVEKARLQAQQACQAKRQQNAVANAELDHKKAELVKLDESLAQLRFNIEENGDLPIAVDRAKQQVEQAKRLQEAQIKSAELTQKLATLKQTGIALNEREQAALSDANRIERDWHLGQAAILSRSLQSGQPCPVCGSDNHPSPAVSEIEPPSQNDVAQARDKAAELTQELSLKREAYSLTNKDLENITNVITEVKALLGDEENLSVDALEQRYLEIKRQCDIWMEQRASLKGLESKKAELSASIAQLEQRLAHHKAEFDHADKMLTEIEKEYALVVAELPEAYRQSDAVQKALTSLEAQMVTADDQVKSLQKRQSAMQSALDEATATQRIRKESCEALKVEFEHQLSSWLSALSNSVFNDQTDFLSAILDSEQQHQVQERIQRYESDRLKKQGALTAIESELKNQTPPDMATVEAVWHAAKLQLEQAEQQWRALHNQQIVLEEKLKGLEQIKRETEALQQQYAVAGTLSDVANGQTGNKVSLQRFVLSVLLDDVLIEASHRLSLMSKGRYRLLRKEDRAKGNRASGLDLEVEDAYAGRIRAVATLSGGESFMAALALALGLSDVVQAYAGGIRLDTLFIDEGFGSLDPESLDLAIRTLTDLQQSGRMIGIISHVTELKEQIPLRIDILSSERGSRICWRDS